MNLDEIRLYSVDFRGEGVEPVSGGVTAFASDPRLRELNVIGSDYSGFIFLEDEDGRIFCLDTDSGELTCEATDFDTFVSEVVFGVRSGEFMGDDWLEELKKAVMIPA